MLHSTSPAVQQRSGVLLCTSPAARPTLHLAPSVIPEHKVRGGGRLGCRGRVFPESGSGRAHPRLTKGAFNNLLSKSVGRKSWQQTKSNYLRQHTLRLLACKWAASVIFISTPFIVLGFGQTQAMGGPSVIDLKVQRLLSGSRYRKSDLGGFPSSERIELAGGGFELPSIRATGLNHRCVSTR